MNLAQVLTVAEKIAEFHAVGSAMLMRNTNGEEDLTAQFRGGTRESGLLGPGLRN